ncbi:MAG: adenylosuccinate lyase [Deltaproteobacteria bacterium]|nr:adenylosuccinate lyase [Deltaproteobacteria bacterium]
MIARYSLPKMSRIWSDEEKYRRWLDVEVAAARAQGEAGLIPGKDAEAIASATVNAARIAELEEVTKHDTLAFVEMIGEQIGDAAKSVHWGLTSSDVVDTASALLLKEALSEIISSLKELSDLTARLAQEHKSTLMVGRTHGIHAEPMSLGLKFALWFQELNRDLMRLERAKETISVGKFSGSVGTSAHLPPEVEGRACELLGLKPAPLSSQVIQRDRHAEVIVALAFVAAALEKIATELRHLQRTEVAEVEEGFAKGQGGSSSMPHKKNPISAENICGLARLVRSYVTPAMENIALWHERDISHSSVERVILPDATILVHYMLERMRGLLSSLVIHRGRMKENLEMTKGLIYSQKVLLTLMGRGMPRTEAYRLVQEASHRSSERGSLLLQELSQRAEVVALLSLDELRGCFDPSQYLKHVDALFARVFQR